MRLPKYLFQASVFLLLLGLTFLPSVHAIEYSISLNNDRFDVSWHISAWQNVTGYPSTKIFPEHVNYSLNSTELASFTSTLQSSMRRNEPSITVSQTSVQIASNNATTRCTPQCPRQWFNLTINFQVHEDAPQSSASIVSYGMSWKAIRLNDSLTAAGFEFNQIGVKYLAPSYTPIVNTRSVVGRTVTVVFGSLTVTNTTYQEAAKSIVLLDMSRIRAPIDNWTLTRDFGAQKNVWTSPRSGGFLTFADFRITEGGTSTDLFYFAEARITAQVSAPLTTFASGDTLHVDLSNGFWDKLGFSIIAGTVGLLAVTFVLDRRITGTQLARRKGKRKP